MGRSLTRRLLDSGNELVLIARGRDAGARDLPEHPSITLEKASVAEEPALRSAFRGCDAVAHLAGINRETGSQTFDRVHVGGTRNVVNAAGACGVDRVVLMSFLRARPDCGSDYHESKWRAEEIVRGANVDHTILKAGVTYGKGDHMLDHLVKVLNVSPVFALVGRTPRRTAPVSVRDMTRLLEAVLCEGRLTNRTVPVTGPEEMELNEAVRRVARVVGADPWYVRLPVRVHYGIAGVLETVMKQPPASLAQVRILSEGLVEPAPAAICDPLPDDLAPSRRMSPERIREGMPETGTFQASNLRVPPGDCCRVAQGTARMVLNSDGSCTA